MNRPAPHAFQRQQADWDAFALVRDLRKAARASGDRTRARAFLFIPALYALGCAALAVAK